MKLKTSYWLGRCTIIIDGAVVRRESYSKSPSKFEFSLRDGSSLRTLQIILSHGSWPWCVELSVDGRVLTNVEWRPYRVGIGF